MHAAVPPRQIPFKLSSNSILAVLSCTIWYIHSSRGHSRTNNILINYSVFQLLSSPPVLIQLILMSPHKIAPLIFSLPPNEWPSYSEILLFFCYSNYLTEAFWLSHCRENTPCRGPVLWRLYCWLGTVELAWKLWVAVPCCSFQTDLTLPAGLDRGNFQISWWPGCVNSDMRKGCGNFRNANCGAHLGYLPIIRALNMESQLFEENLFVFF